MSHRFGVLEARNIGNGCVSSQVEEHLRADQRARAAVIEAHFKRFRRDEAPAPHDQFRAACFVVAQMGVHERLDHVALASTNLRHVDFDRASDRAELRGVARQMRDLGATNFILAGQTRDVWTGAADPPALDDCGPASRARHVPSGQFAPASAAKDKNIVLFGLRHEHPPYMKGSWPFRAANFGRPMRRQSQRQLALIGRRGWLNVAPIRQICGANYAILGQCDDPQVRDTVTTKLCYDRRSNSAMGSNALYRPNRQRHKRKRHAEIDHPGNKGQIEFIVDRDNARPDHRSHRTLTLGHRPVAASLGTRAKQSKLIV